MNVNTINGYFNELARCEFTDFDDTLSVEQHFYNGVSGAQGREFYGLFLGNLHNIFLQEVQSLLLDKEKYRSFLNGLLHRIEQVAEMYFDVPSVEAICALEKDMELIPQVTLLNELKRSRFLKEMNDTQKYFINETKTFLEVVTTEEVKEMEQPQKRERKDPIKDVFVGFLSFIADGGSVKDRDFEERANLALSSALYEVKSKMRSKELKEVLLEELKLLVELLGQEVNVSGFEDSSVDEIRPQPNQEKKHITIKEAIEWYGAPRKSEDRQWREQQGFPVFQRRKGCCVVVEVDALKNWLRGRK